MARLLEDLFPNSGEIVLERMKGGGFNRVIGAKLSSGECVVVRIPRFDSDKSELADQAAVLRYIASLKIIPVPHIAHFDTTDQNIIGSAYMVQHRIEGQNLNDVISSLSQKKCLEVTKEVARVIAQMCSITFEHIGTLCAPSAAYSLRDIGFITPPNSSTTSPFSDTLEYLVQSFNGHIIHPKTGASKGTVFEAYMSLLTDVARDLNARRPFTNKFCLFHSDFMARNLLVKDEADGRLVINGVLDWDLAASAPVEAAYVLPHWLWEPGEEEDINEATDGSELADLTPATPELRAIKELFEKEIEKLVPGFVAMWKEGWAARELFYFAIEGMNSNEDMARVDLLCHKILGADVSIVDRMVLMNSRSL